MGNTVSASCPAEVRSIESYLNENCENVESLGSTRFMKVAKARGENGYLKVYKLFINMNESLSTEALTKFQQKLINIGKTLSKQHNCLPVRVVLNKGKDGTLLIRSFQKYTLFDRLSTRPFINEQERIWYIYQLFKALDQCQRLGVCHGDLKSQNVLLSSANWLQITDFASFKPTFIQLDNPSFFTFFFDTSRRQSCYLAPERLLTSANFEIKQNSQSGDHSGLFDNLTPAMDMFSAGCVVYEILCEGRAPFSYSQLCEYRNMTAVDAAHRIERLLEDVPVKFKALLKVLLNREPSMRSTARQVLAGDAFSFSPFLEWYYQYMTQICPSEVHNIEEPVPSSRAIESSIFWLASHDPDHIIMKLVLDEEQIFTKLKETEESRVYAVLVVSLITANLRSLKGAKTKVDALRLLVKLSYLCDSTVALERILPYLVFMLSDQHVTVRVCAIHSIVDLVKPLEPANVEQSLVFVDYILPELIEMLKKSKSVSFVTQTFAANLGYIAQSALRFHNVGWRLRSIQDDECSGAEKAKSRREELDTLAKAIEDIFTSLSSSDNTFRHSLINPTSLAALFKFFGSVDNRQYDDFLISHMITFFNVKGDWRLRTAVFDALPICLQKQTVDIRSLLQQGLQDFEELVVVRVLHCIYCLIARNLLDRSAILDLLRDISPFLAHPNEWIRISVVNIFVLLDSKWTPADIHSKLLVEIGGYLECPMFRLNSRIVVRKNLKKPIPRYLWMLLIGLNEDEMKILCTRLETAVKEGTVVQLNESLLKKSGKIGEIDAELTWKLSKFSEHFVKMVIFRKSNGMESELTMRKGKIDLTAHPLVKRHEHEYGKTTPPSSVIDAASFLNNQEWNEMFSNSDSFILERQQSVPHVAPSTCAAQLQRLLAHKDHLYLNAKGAHPEFSSIRIPHPSSDSKVQATLLTHLHEHTDKVIKIAKCPQHQQVVTVSADGSLKIWSERSLFGECYGAVRSEHTYYPGQSEKHRSSLKAGDWMCEGRLFIVSNSDGEIIIMDLAANRDKPDTRLQLPKEDGLAEAIHTDNNVAYVRTHHGIIYCLDRRLGKSNGPLGRHEIWRRKISSSHGLITSSCIDPWKSNWMVLAATNKQLLLWDLRYQQKVSSFMTKKKGGVPVKLWSNPCSSYDDPQIFVSPNIMADVGIYNIARGTQSKVLWSSLHPPLKYPKDSGLNESIVTGALCVNQDTGEVFTGDSQGSLRKWNLGKPRYSAYLSGIRKNQCNQSIIYQEEIATDDDGENIPVISEYRSSQGEENNLPSLVAMEVKGATSHRTSITDVLCLNNDHLISSSADGVTKVWKITPL